jgi:hydrogenase nickel incorporation protein HypA/HybF
MHEMSICQALINQVEQIAQDKGAGEVSSITLSIGPLSGVEPQLLNHAFEIARHGSVAQGARLEIETGPVVVECRSCGCSGKASVNHLMCPSCGHWQVNLVQGDELLLLRLEIGYLATAGQEPD